MVNLHEDQLQRVWQMRKCILWVSSTCCETISGTQCQNKLKDWMFQIRSASVGGWMHVWHCYGCDPLQHKTRPTFAIGFDLTLPMKTCENLGSRQQFWHPEMPRIVVTQVNSAHHSLVHADWVQRHGLINSRRYILLTKQYPVNKNGLGQAKTLAIYQDSPHVISRR